MALYNQVKTAIINSSYHSNRMSVFDIPQKSLKNNLRLAHFGCVRSGGDNTTSYPSTSGVLSIIKQITLFNDNIEIDAVREAHQLYAFQQALSSNPHSYSIEGPLTSTNLGWKMADPKKIEIFGSASNVLGDTEETTSKNLISLSKLLSFFRSAEVDGARMLDVPADKLKLRLQIEYNTDVSQFAGLAPSSITIIEPILIVDENINATPSPKEIQYKSMEHDRVVVDAVSEGVTQSVKEKVNGFNKKALNRLLVINSPASPSADACRFDCSKAMHKEQLQFNVDGKSLFMYNGLDTPATKSDLLQKTFIEALNCPISQNGLKLLHRSDIMSSNTQATDQNFSYGGFYVNARPEQLEVVYSREGLKANEPNTQAFNLTFYGEVSKVLVMTGSTPIVAY